jgi:hypothetical protein
MHLYDTLNGQKAKDLCLTTVKLPADCDIESVVRIEVYGTDLSDPGEDYCEYRVYDSADKLVCVRREMGY